MPNGPSIKHSMGKIKKMDEKNTHGHSESVVPISLRPQHEGKIFPYTVWSICRVMFVYCYGIKETGSRDKTKNKTRTKLWLIIVYKTK